MRNVAILLLLAVASPAFADGNGAPAPDPNQKPFIYDRNEGPGLKSFSAPTPVTVIVPGDPVPKVEPTALPPTPKTKEEAAPPVPKPAPKGFG